MIKYASEVVIFILVRIDSPERARNLDLTLSHLYGTGIRIEVWEIDAEQKYQLKLSSERIFYHFVFDCDPVFHRTLYWDSLFKKSKYPVVGIWDADIIVEYWQIEEAVPGMGDVVGIVMSACGRKGHVAPRRAASVGMDMKAQKAGNGQSYRPGNDQRPAPVGAEQDLAPQVWMGLVAPELSPGGGAGQGNRMVHGADLLSHAYARQ